MSNKLPAWQVYASQLSKVDRGQAMWFPEHPQPVGITIGDVGYIQQDSGLFCRLFNITMPREDDLNMGSLKPPEDFKRLNYNAILKAETKNYIQAGTIASKSVKKLEVSPHAGGGTAVVSGEAGFKYACSKSQGALLYLDNAADREAVYTNEVWVKYIRTNYPSWIKILESVGLNDEIVVVRGWIKASAWAVAAWCDKSTEHQVTLSGSGGIAQAGFSFTSSDESNNSVEKRTGPDPPGDAITESGGSLPKDQTIFMSYYKIVDRFFFFSIKAKAGSHNLPRGDGGDSGNDPFYIDNEGIETTKTYDPLDDIVDHLFRNSDAKYAIVSDADLFEICNGADVPLDFPAFLKQNAPRFEIINGAACFSIMESIYKSHEHRGANAIPALLPLQHPPGNPPGGGASFDTRPDDIRSGTITLPEFSRDARTTKWPHVVFLDPEAEGGAPCPAALSKDGNLVGIGFEDCMVRVWNVATEELVREFEQHVDSVSCVAFSPDNKTLISGSADTDLILWDLKTGAAKMQLDDHDKPICCVVFSPDGRTVASGSADTTVRFWDVNSGTMLAIGEGHTASIQDMVYLPDGSRLVSCADLTGKIWNPTNGTCLHSMHGHTGVIWSVTVSHQGHRVATGSEDHTVRLWNPKTGAELVTIWDHTGPVWSVQFSPDDRKLVSGAYDATITMHDVMTGDLYFSLQAGNSIVHAVAYSPIGDLIAGGYADGTIKLWNGITGAFIAELKGHTDKVKALVCSPDNDSIVSSSDDGTVRVWSAIDVLRVY